MAPRLHTACDNFPSLRAVTNLHVKLHPAPAALLSPNLPGGHYVVMEHFYTLQGEGAHVGCPAYFIRLGGCDVGCHWCDVKDSWHTDWPILPAAKLATAAKASGAPIAVITGGEPLLHDLTMLADALQAAGLRVHLETSGAHPLTGNVDWVTFSPKKFKAPLEAFYAVADELKVIVHNRHDLTWAETHAEKVRPSCVRLLQPEWYTPESAGWIVDYVKAHPHWRVSLQTHKYLDIP